MVYEDQGEPFIMREGDCVLQPPQIRHRVLESSGPLEVIEVSLESFQVEKSYTFDRRVNSSIDCDES